MTRVILFCTFISTNKQNNKAMKNLANLIKNAETKVLVSTMISTLGDFSKAKLNVMIQEELEIRIGEDKVDEILDANR